MDNGLYWAKCDVWIYDFPEWQVVYLNKCEFDGNDQFWFLGYEYPFPLEESQIIELGDKIEHK